MSFVHTNKFSSCTTGIVSQRMADKMAKSKKAVSLKHAQKKNAE